MKAIEKVSNTVATKPATPISINTVEFSATKIWLPLVFGASLLYMGNPPHAGERQGAGNQPMQSQGSQGQAGKSGRAYGTERQGAGRGTRPATGYTEEERNKSRTTMEQEINTRPGSESMEKGSDPGSTDTNPGREDMNRETVPGRDTINRDTTGPGGDNMMRDAIPGGSGINRE